LVIYKKDKKVGGDNCLLVCLANNPANSKTPLMGVDLFAKFAKFAKYIYIYITGIFTQTSPYHFFLIFFPANNANNANNCGFFFGLSIPYD